LIKLVLFFSLALAAPLFALNKLSASLIGMGGCAVANPTENSFILNPATVAGC
jgi:hypothetical protein